jgi:hypothetical protein
LSTDYVQGLVVTFMLVLGLVSLLDMVFSTVNLSDALAFAMANDIKRRNGKDADNLEKLVDQAMVNVNALTKHQQPRK